VDLTFDAFVGIVFMAKSDLTLVGFDSYNHTVHNLKLFDLFLGNRVESKFQIDTDKELILVNANFSAGHLYRLEIDYSAPLSNQSFGFYYVEYFDEEDKSR
jgi:hypothetical protein